MESRAISIFKDIFKEIMGQIVKEKNGANEVDGGYLLNLAHEKLAENEFYLKYYNVSRNELSEFDGLILKWYQAIIEHMNYYKYDWPKLRENYLASIRETLY